MEFLLGLITQRINVLYKSRMKWTWHHSKLAVEEVSFFADSEWYSFNYYLYTIEQWALRTWVWCSYGQHMKTKTTHKDRSTKNADESSDENWLEFLSRWSVIMLPICPLQSTKIAANWGGDTGWDDTLIRDWGVQLDSHHNPTQGTHAFKLHVRLTIC